MIPSIWRGLALVPFLCTAPSIEAGIPLYRNGDGLSLDLGIRVQLQYYHLGEESSSEKKLFFRRLRPALEASFSSDWEAEAELDFGETVEGEAIEFKDMAVSYLGLESRGFRLAFGNDKAVYSRQFQSSSKSLTLVERGVVGDDDFGSLDRVLGARVDGRDATGRLGFAASFGLASHEPDASQMEFESPLNAWQDANPGWALSARAEVAPLGEVPYDQGDFGSEELRFALGGSVYRWTKDGSRTAGAQKENRVDLDRARGVELGGALRGKGLSADGEVQWVRGEAADPSFDGGIYEDGEANLSKLSLQSAYMVLRERLEIAGGCDRLNAAAYESAWKRLSLGANYYFRRERLKLQVNYLLHWSYFGSAGGDPQEIRTQLQLVF